MGWQNLEPIFEELEAEFGNSVSEAIVEAQRRFTKSGFFHVEIENEAVVRTELALRGLGNLKGLVYSSQGLHIRLENAVLPWILVGIAQGLYEISCGSESNVKWELREEGNLEIEVTPT